MNIHEIWKRLIKMKNEKKHKFNHLATYIFENKQIVITMSVEEISKYSYTSISTFYRFIKELGLENFKELKFIIKNRIEMELGEKLFSLSSFDDSVVPMLYEETLMNLNENFILLEQQKQQIMEAATMMKKSGKILLIGLNYSWQIINDIYYKLIKTNKNCLKSNDIDQISFLTKILNKDDLIFIVSYSGNNDEMIRIIDEIEDKNKPKIISITTNINNVVANKSDVNIKVSSNESTDRIFPLKSRNALLTATDCLFISFLNLSPDRYLDLLNVVKKDKQYKDLHNIKIK